jgi:integrase
LKSVEKVRNVTELIDPPRVARKEMQVLTPAQAKQLLAGAADHPLQFLLTAAVTTGMRQGELFALQWRDVDLPAKTLTVRRALVRAPDGGTMFAEPKTAGATRRIHLSDLTVDALRAQWRRQQDARREAGEHWVDLGLVFANRYGRPLSPQNVLQRQLHPLLDRLGLPRIRFHDLRHTAATLLLSAGEHPKVVSELLGHTEIGITLNLYSHVIPGLHERAAATFDQLLADPGPVRPDVPATYDGGAPAADTLAVKLAVKPRSPKVKAQVSPRSSGDRASVS